MMKRILSRAVTAVLCAVALACGRSANQNIEGMPAPDEPVTVTVENSNWQDVTVYAVHSGERYRLGNVTTAQTKTFKLPRGGILLNGFQVLIDPIGGSGLLTNRVNPGPGNEVVVRVANVLTQTSVTIR